MGVALCGSNPYSFGCGYAQGNLAGAGNQGQGLIVISSGNVHTRAGANAAILKKFQQAAVALVNATDQIILSRLGVSQQQQTTPAPAYWTLQFTQVAVRTSASAAQSR